MPKLHVRGDKLTITIPAKIRDEIAALHGDEIDVRTEDGRIVLTPKEGVAERHTEIDSALAEGLEDERAGRLSPPFQTAEEIEEWQKKKNGAQGRIAASKL